MKQPGSRHGFKATKSRVMVQGLACIDRRTLAAQALLEWKKALIADLGGDVSTQQETLVELAVRTRLLVEHIDSFILSQQSLVNKKKRQIYPIVKDRQHLVDSLARLLKDLGLERREKHVGSLQEYLEQRAKGATNEGQSDDSGRDAGREDSGKDVSTEVGEGHVGNVEELSQGPVRAPDDGGTAQGLPAVHVEE
jgi:hypothetical protein